MLPQWVALWLGVFLCAAVSGWGRGLWLEASPQRLMVLLGPPLGLAAAAGLGRLGPVAGWVALRGVVGLGVVSVAVSAVYFQAGLGGTAWEGPFGHLRYARLHPSDAARLAALPPGRYLTPGWRPVAAGEWLAQRPGIRVIGGPGAMNLGDQPLARVQGAVDAFFWAGQDDASRAAVLRDWCVDYVYCAAGAPLDGAVVAELSAWAARVGAPLVAESGTLWVDVRGLRGE